MKRLVVIAVSATVLALSCRSTAFAGEVKGPPNQLNNTNETGALDHANSACAVSGLNDFDLCKRTDGVTGSDCRGLLEVLRASEGFPRHVGTLQGRNWREVRLVLAPIFGRGQITFDGIPRRPPAAQERARSWLHGVGVAIRGPPAASG